MTARYLVDTNTLTLYIRSHPKVIANVVHHLGDEMATSAVTVEEILGGWYTALRKAKTPQQIILVYDRLTATMNGLREWDVVSFSTPAFQRYEQLKRQKLNVPKQDLRIAAIALEWQAVVVT